MRLKTKVEYTENIRRLTIRELGEWLIDVADREAGKKMWLSVFDDGEITVTVRDR